MQHTVLGILLLVALAAPTQATLDTCDGAYALVVDFDDVKCPPSMLLSTSAAGAMKNSSTCKTTACAAAISALDYSTLSLMKTGLTACPETVRKQLAFAMNYVNVMAVATMCGHPASIAAGALGPLNTCDGASGRYVAFIMQECPTFGQNPFPEQCGNDACKAAISSFDDNTLSLMKTGFADCGKLPEDNGMKTYENTQLDYRRLRSTAALCGHPLESVKATVPAPNTCEGAYNGFMALISACPARSWPNSSVTCGNDACKAAISSIDDSTLSTMKTGFTACGNLPDSDGMKYIAVYATYVDYQYINSLATQCNLPANTVKLTPPALNTCDGAYGRVTALWNACPGPYSPATCGNDACKTSIISINEETASSMKTGFMACGNLPDSDGRKSLILYADSVTYENLYYTASQCGFPEGTVKLNPPTLKQSSDSCDRANDAFSKLNTACRGDAGQYSKATCGTLACIEAINAIDDGTLTSIRAGFKACKSAEGDQRKSLSQYAEDFNYAYLHKRATECELPQNTVKLTPCSLCGKGMQMPDASKGTFLAHSCSIPGGQTKSSDSASCTQKGGGDTYQNYTCGSYDESLKTKFWFLDGLCESNREMLLYGAKDIIFADPASKVRHCKCPVPYEAKLTPTQNEPPVVPLPTTQPQITTIFNTVSSDVTHVVKITLSLPMRKADFTSDKQTLFKKSLAAAVGKGVLEADVTIEIEPINGGRRLLAESITVRSTIKVPNQAAADTMAKALTQEKINDELSKSGLPAAKLLDVAATTMKVGAETESFADKVKSEATSAIIGGAIAGVFSLAGVVSLAFRKWISSKCGCSEESDQNQEPLAEHKAAAEASTVTSEVTVEASAVASAAANTRAQTENPV
jgi:hypothetical protein